MPETLNLPVSPHDGQGLLLALGVGAIAGAMLGGWVMNSIHKLMFAAVKMVLLGAVVIVGVSLWNRSQQSRSQTPHESAGHSEPDRYSQQTTSQPERQPNDPQDRWWEQH